MRPSITALPPNQRMTPEALQKTICMSEVLNDCAFCTSNVRLKTSSFWLRNFRSSWSSAPKALTTRWPERFSCSTVVSLPISICVWSHMWRIRLLAQMARAAMTGANARLMSASGRSRKQHHRRGACGEQDYLPGPDEPHAHEHPRHLHVHRGLGHEVAGVLPVVERETQVLQLVVQHVADAVRDSLGDGLRHVEVSVVEDAPRGDDADHQQAQPHEVAAVPLPPGADRGVDRIAHQPGHCEEEHGCGDERDPGYDEPPLLQGGEFRYAPEDSSHRVSGTGTRVRIPTSIRHL